MMPAGEKAASASGEFIRFFLWVSGTAVVIAALGYFPTLKVAGESAITPMIGAIGAVALGSIIGGVPIFRARLRGAAKPGVVMVSMIVRLVAVVILAAFTGLLLELRMEPFLVWLALSYLLLLVVDTRYSMTVLGSL